MIVMTSSLSKNYVFKMVSVHTKTKSRRSQIPPVEKRFQKAPFSRRNSIDGKPNRRNKAGENLFIETKLIWWVGRVRQRCLNY